jgi:putative phosphoesterase
MCIDQYPFDCRRFRRTATVRIAVISDIHSNYDALQAVLSAIGDYDALVCLGDLVGYGAQPNEVVSKIRSLRPKAIVMGNHDYAISTGDTSGFVQHAMQAVEWTRKEISPENLRYIANLRTKTTYVVDGVKIALAHGSPRDPLNEYVYPDTAEFILRSLVEDSGGTMLLLGHTHVPFVRKFDSMLLGNPGGVGQPRDGDARASCAILEPFAEPEFQIHRVVYDVDAAARKIVAAGLPRLLADRLHLGV